MLKNNLIRKIRLISIFVASQPVKQTIAMHILPNIARSKCNQTTKFGQLIEYKMGNIFLKKSLKICGGKIGSIVSFTQFAFIVCQIKGYRNTLKPHYAVNAPWAYTWTKDKFAICYLQMEIITFI